jgi:hypothetical protein
MPFPSYASTAFDSRVQPEMKAVERLAAARWLQDLTGAVGSVLQLGGEFVRDPATPFD